MTVKKKPVKTTAPAKKRASTPCVYKLFDVLSPYMGKMRGEVLRASLPNKARKAFGAEVTSYSKPYLIQEFAITSDKDVERAIKSLRMSGYDPVMED